MGLDVAIGLLLASVCWVTMIWLDQRKTRIEREKKEAEVEALRLRNLTRTDSVQGFHLDQASLMYRCVNCFTHIHERGVPRLYMPR